MKNGMKNKMKKKTAMELKQTIQKILVLGGTGIEILLIVQTLAFARMGKAVAMLITG